MGENNEGVLGKSDGTGKRLFREMPSTEGVSEIRLFVGVRWVVGWKSTGYSGSNFEVYC